MTVFFDQNQINDEALQLMTNKRAILEIPLFAPDPYPSDRILYARMDAEGRDFSGNDNHLNSPDGDLTLRIDPAVVKERNGRNGTTMNLNNGDTGFTRNVGLANGGAEPGLLPLSEFTIAFWFRLDEVPPVGEDRIIMIEKLSNGGEFSIRVRNDGAGLAEFLVRQDATPPPPLDFLVHDTDVMFIKPGDLYFLAYVFDSGEATSARLYIAPYRSLQGNAPTISVVGSDPSFVFGGTGIDNFRVGGDGTDSSPKIMIDDLQIWKVGLTNTELNTLLKDYNYTGLTSGRPKPVSVFTATVDAATNTHIFGGGQQSGVTRRTDGRDIARQDQLMVIRSFPGFDEKSTVIIDNVRYEVRYIQDAGGRGHHMQAFIREAKG